MNSKQKQIAALTVLILGLGAAKSCSKKKLKRLQSKKHSSQESITSPSHILGSTSHHDISENYIDWKDTNNLHNNALDNDTDNSPCSSKPSQFDCVKSNQLKLTVPNQSNSLDLTKESSGSYIQPSCHSHDQSSSISKPVFDCNLDSNFDCSKQAKYVKTNVHSSASTCHVRFENSQLNLSKNLPTSSSANTDQNISKSDKIVSLKKKSLKNIKKKKKRIWVKARQDNEIDYELRTVERKSFLPLLKMPNEVFYMILEKILPRIQRQDTVMRRSISPEIRLEATLR